MTTSVSRWRRAAHGALYVLLGGWLGASILSQEPTRKFSGARKIDKLGLFIPDWRFFAPRPGMHDHHILFRDELADHSLTDWKEIAKPTPRVLSHALFYPARRGEKAVTDAVVGVIATGQLGQLKRKEDIQLTLAYVTILNFVSYQAQHAPSAVKTQFALASSAGRDTDEEPEVLFLSNLHKIT